MSTRLVKYVKFLDAEGLFPVCVAAYSVANKRQHISYAWQTTTSHSRISQLVTRVDIASHADVRK
jgi:hypothetical protein